MSGSGSASQSGQDTSATTPSGSYSDPAATDPSAKSGSGDTSKSTSDSGKTQP
jgi:hypothetical protein